MNTAVNYEERVAIWRRMVRLRTFTPRAFSRTGWLLLQELKAFGYIDVTPLGWRIARGTACMPREVDPAHWWQRAAWCALRWYPAGVSLDHLHMLTEPSTGVAAAGLRAWLKLCVLTGVVEMSWRKEPRRRKYYRCLRMNDPEPPHRFELVRRAKRHDLQVEVELAGDAAESAKSKLILFQLAEELGNVSQACHIMGYHPHTFYKVRRAFKVGGVAALVEKKRGPKGPHPNRLASEIEQQILALCLERPTWGIQRIAGELRLKDVNVSPSGVHGVWLRHDLTHRHQRLLRLEKEAQKGTIMLSEEQVRLLAGLRQGSMPRKCP